MTSRLLQPGLAAVALAVLAALLYLPSIRNGYVLDDPVIVGDNPMVLELRVGEALTSPYWPNVEGVRPGAANWRPLAMLSFLMERFVGGPRVAALHHAGNALLHGLVVLAIFPLARRFTGRWALAACALFAAHPGHAEVVAPIVGRCDLLAALGALLALVCFLRYRDGGQSRWLWLGATAYALGLGGKESAAPVIALLPAADLLLRAKPWRAIAGREALAYLPFAAVALLYVAARVAVLGEWSFQHAGDPETPYLHRLLLAARNAVVSTGLLFLPVRFHHTLTSLPAAPPWEHPDPRGLAAAAYVAGGLAIALGWLALRRAAPRAAFLWLAALLTWLPTSGLIPAAAGVSLRFLFLPTAFLACGLALAMERAAAWRPAGRPLLLAAVVIAASAGAAGTVRRTLQWRDHGSFYQAVVAEVPDAYSAHSNLVVWYATRRPPDLERARLHAREAIRATGDSPWSFAAQLDLAMTYEIGPAGQQYGPGAELGEAQRLYVQRIQAHPERAEPHLLLAGILEHQGRPAEARQHRERARQLAPGPP